MAPIIVLNGPSSSGKTTLGRALQRSLGTGAIYLPIDALYPSSTRIAPTTGSCSTS